MTRDKDRMKVVSMRMPDSFRKRIERAMRERGFHNLSEFVRVALNEFVKKETE